MPKKQLVFDEQARQRILTGVSTLAKAVKVTLGPKGRNVMVSKPYGAPKVTKDGVSVAKEIELPDPFENMGAQMVREVASRTADKAGDGTTTSVVLAEAIYRAGLKAVAAGANPIFIKRGIDKAAQIINAEVSEMAIPVTTRDELLNVAIVSTNNDEELGGIIADAMTQVGKDGTVTVEDSRSGETYLNVVEGISFDKGFVTHYFATNMERQETVFDETLVLIHDKKIANFNSLLPALKIAAAEKKALLIIADDIEGEALTHLVMNTMRGSIKACAVKAPGFGDRRKAMMEDLAVLTGAKIIAEEIGLKLESVQRPHLGLVSRAIVDGGNTTLIGHAGQSDAIAGRVSQVRRQIEQSTSDYDIEKLKERLARLSGGVGVIFVGATTEAELKEKKDRVDDALHATRAANEEGIVAGGGTALLRASRVLKAKLSSLKGDEKHGAQIVLDAVKEPLRCLCQNAGIDGSLIVEKVIQGKKGYNVATGRFEDLIKSGVVDPAKVTKTALANAASVAGLLLTTECLVVELPEPVTPGMVPQQ